MTTTSTRFMCDLPRAQSGHEGPGREARIHERSEAEHDPRDLLEPARPSMGDDEHESWEHTSIGIVQPRGTRAVGREAGCEQDDPDYDLDPHHGLKDSEQAPEPVMWGALAKVGIESPQELCRESDRNRPTNVTMDLAHGGRLCRCFG